MRILLLSLAASSIEAVNSALAGQGYEISTESGLTVDEVLALSPEVLVTEATPSDLSCCGLITQLKSQPDTSPSLKVVMIVHGGALERARALDLGTDDVISFPFDAVEFAARIRTQFRERKPQEELKTMLKYAVQRERYADIVVESLSAGTVSKHRLWLIPTLLALSVVAVLAALFTSFSTRRSHKDALQLRAEVARLNSSLQPQGELLRRAEQARGSLDRNSRSASVARDSLKAQSEDLRKKVAASDGGADADSLKQQLLETQNRLALLEKEGKAAETVVQKYGPSVCLLHVIVEFVDKQSGQPLQVALDANGKPQVDDKGMAQLDVGGNGPHLQIDAFGTGFLAGPHGTILTNHHVVEPWWHDDELKQLLDHGVDPLVVSYDAYFPGKPAATRARLGRISSEADVATLKLEASPPDHAELLELDDRRDSVTGEAVVLMGYPTGVEGILARAGSDVVRKIANGAQDVSQVMSQIASQQLIRPTTTQGHIGDVLKDKIVYDAATTSGGSGGPLFNSNGKVIGINFAVLKDFGGSNLAVPIRFAKDLLR
jgi:S1-C subfamily serine protease